MKKTSFALVLALMFCVVTGCVTRYMAVHEVSHTGEESITGGPGLRLSVEHINRLDIAKYQSRIEGESPDTIQKRDPYVTVFRVQASNASAEDTITVDFENITLSYGSTTNAPYSYQRFYRTFPSYDFSAMRYLSLLFYSMEGTRAKLGDPIAIQPGGQAELFLIFDAIAENATTLVITMPAIRAEQQEERYIMKYQNIMRRIELSR